MSNPNTWVTASASDGFNVISVNADDLINTAHELRKNHTTVQGAQTALMSALVPAEAFGTLDGATGAAARLQTMVNDYIAAFEKMGVSVQDLAARVQAAGQLADQMESDTVKVAYIPTALEPSTNG